MAMPRLGNIVQSGIEPLPTSCFRNWFALAVPIANALFDGNRVALLLCFEPLDQAISKSRGWSRMVRAVWAKAGSRIIGQFMRDQPMIVLQSLGRRPRTASQRGTGPRSEDPFDRLY